MSTPTRTLVSRTLESRPPAPRTLLRRLAALAAALAMTLAVALAGGSLPASAQPQAHRDVVGERPVPWTPHVQNGTVHALAQVGDAVVVGGTFTEIADPTGQVTVPRRFLFAFGLNDGRLLELAPALDGPVYALAAGPQGTVYVGGAFRTVDGSTQRGVAQLRVSDGVPVSEFRTSINWGRVQTMASHGDRLFLGGTFSAVNGVPRAGLAMVNGTTGALDLRLDAGLTHSDGGGVTIQSLSLAPDGSRLVAVGAFTHSHGWQRPQLVMLDTSEAVVRLANWYTDAYERPCTRQFRTYLRGVDFAPDGSYFVAVTTGGMTRPDHVCNTAARFEATGTGMHRPSWVNHTGGNSLYSVAVTGAAVYVGGHQQWHDNPNGNKFAGPGAVAREGIAALHPGNGRALPWNPGRARGVGVQAFLATPTGLVVGSDTTRIGGVYRARLALMPLPR